MIVDEIGVVDRRTFDVATLASGKRAASRTLLIGTPSPGWDRLGDVGPAPVAPAITIVGIPLAVANLKMVPISLVP